MDERLYTPSDFIFLPDLVCNNIMRLEFSGDCICLDEVPQGTPLSVQEGRFLGIEVSDGEGILAFRRCMEYLCSSLRRWISSCGKSKNRCDCHGQAEAFSGRLHYKDCGVSGGLVE